MESQLNAGWLASALRNETDYPMHCKVQKILEDALYITNETQEAAVEVFRNDSESIEIFLKIAYLLPNLATESDVTLAFEILRGKRSFDDQESQRFLLEVVGLTQEQASLNNSGWIEFEDWVK